MAKSKTYKELVEEGHRKKHNPAPKPKPEKVWGFSIGSVLGMLAVFAVKFVIDFLVIPKIWPDFFPISWPAVGIWLASTVLFTVISMQFITRFGYFYVAAAIMYGILVLVWPMGLYGTAETMPFVIAVLMGVIIDLISQVILWIYIGVGFMRM
jgi:hypothetical protein